MDREAIRSRLSEADFTMPQSSALADILSEVATRHEVRELRTEMHAEFKAVRIEMRALVETSTAILRTQLRTEMANLRTELRTDTASLRTDIERSAKEIQQRLFTTMVSLIIALTAIFTLLEVYFG